MKQKYLLIKLRGENDFVSYTEVFDDYIDKNVFGEESFMLTEHGYCWIEEAKLILIDFTYTRNNWDRLKQFTFYKYFMEFYLIDKWKLKFKELMC